MYYYLWCRHSRRGKWFIELQISGGGKLEGTGVTLSLWGNSVRLIFYYWFGSLVKNDLFADSNIDIFEKKNWKRFFPRIPSEISPNKRKISWIYSQIFFRRISSENFSWFPHKFSQKFLIRLLKKTIFSTNFVSFLHGLIQIRCLLFLRNVPNNNLIKPCMNCFENFSRTFFIDFLKKKKLT